ncbi:hypothetical protein SAMN05444157_0989 [Frankineae bacterium MT45]|nr:hypothetical protein SAMN05444157_0989 [Frankineae bacterium MT45]
MRRRLLSAILGSLVCAFVTACGVGGPDSVTLNRRDLSTTDATAVTSAIGATSATGTTSATGATPAEATTGGASGAASPYEDDSAVVSWRNWALAAAQAVNAGKVHTTALDELMTPDFAKQTTTLLAPQMGLTYPGPMPFTPISVTDLSPTARSLRICLVTAGFAHNRNAKASTPTHPNATKPMTVRPMVASAIYQNGTWLTSGLASENFSCSGVNPQTPTF